MKVESEIKTNQEYPCLMVHNSAKYVVLAYRKNEEDNEFSGTVIYNPRSDINWSVGQYFDRFSLSLFSKALYGSRVTITEQE